MRLLVFLLVLAACTPEPLIEKPEDTRTQEELVAIPDSPEQEVALVEDLSEPQREQTLLDFPTDQFPSLGAKDAPITVLQIGIIQNGYVKLKEHVDAGTVRLVIVNLGNTGRTDTFYTSFECVNEQGKIEQILQKGRSWSRLSAQDMREFSIDTALFERCMETAKEFHDGRVQLLRSFKIIPASPQYIFNEKVTYGTYGYMQEIALEEELAKI
ncbi:MAG: hypothetical protein OXR66_08135 [Candidatus Woesearchaeota archaeon]|nr:hypothetical protein [Candidatus Woesearchaeota archaeon]